MSSASTTSAAEELVWTGRPSQITNLGIYVLCGLLSVLIVPLLYGLWRWLEIRCLKYDITTERLRLSSGILTRNCDEMELYRIKDIRLVQPLFLRLFGLGNVALLTSDKTTPELTLAAIPDPDGVRELLREHVEQRRDEKRVREVDFD